LGDLALSDGLTILLKILESKKLITKNEVSWVLSGASSFGLDNIPYHEFDDKRWKDFLKLIKKISYDKYIEEKKQSLRCPCAMESTVTQVDQNLIFEKYECDECRERFELSDLIFVE
jgi:hypothetical protein